MNMRILLLLLIVSVVIVSTAITNNAREHSQTVGQSWSRLKAPIETADDDGSNEDNVLRHPVRLLDDDEENGNTNIRDVIRRGYDDWERFKVKHDKQFVGGDDEENERMMTFLTNRQRVRRHNEAYERGEKSFRLELNHLADLSPDEYRKMNGFLRNYGDSTARGNQSTFLAPLNVVVPDRVDWRDHGYVTEGACGSCWAFSATGALEGQHKRKTGNMVSLSEQNLVDCSSAFGNHGCNGGLMDQAFDYIKNNHGIDTESFYPYKGMNQKCHFKKSQVGADDTGFVDLPMGDEEALKVAVATQGPISVAIDAGHPTFQLYRSGVYIDPECSSMQLDHGVLVVGYGTDDVSGQDYWIVKNSWGPKWGASGYILMARNRNNQCGIATKASYPLV